MVAQLIRQDDGSYDYVEVGTVPLPKVQSLNLLSQVSTTAAKSLPVTDEFEAYEGIKKGGEELVSTPSLTEQTEKIQREIPGQVEFDPTTGQFTTVKPEAKYLEYKKPEITPESTEPTATERVMKMAAATRVQPPDYSQIMKDAMAARMEAIKPTIAEQLIGAGKDIAISYVTQRLLSDTFAGSLATSGMMVNPYAAAGMALMQTGVGEDIAKGVGKVAGKAVKAVASAAKSTWDTVTSLSVICTELHKQKLMSKEDCRLSWNFTINNFSSTHLNGYWYWAVPMTKIMKKNKGVTKFWNHIMSNRTKDIKWRLNKGKFNLLGRLYSILIENVSYIIGKLIEKKKIKEVLV